MSEPTNRISDEAAHWAVRLGSRSLLPDEQRELAAWLASDPRHQGALVRARSAWAGLDRFAALAAGRAVEAPRPRTFDRRWVFAAGLSTVMLTGAAGWIVLRPRGTTYASGVGEQRSIPLADGSKMLLNTASVAVVDFEETRREVQLRRGEALFEVAKDSARPFIVRTDRLSVRAVGTAFAVRIDDSRVDVTVTEGVVEISRDDGSDSRASQRVSANERVVVTSSRSVAVEPVRPEEAERRLAWRNGMVAFDGEPLSAAVAEVNRHSRRRIVVDDSALAAQPIVGIFRASDTEKFARTAAAALGAEAVMEDDVIRVQPLKAR